MWEDPWEHCKKGPNTLNDSLMWGKHREKDPKEDVDTGGSDPEGEFNEKS